MASKQSLTPTLVVYKEVVEGDLRKLRAESNDDPGAGGGARDLRLPTKTFRPIMNRIFTKDAIGRGGKQIRVAEMIYLDADSIPRTTRLEYWPPTDARPREDRISKIHKSPALGGRLPDEGRGKVFVLFIKFSNDTVRVTYAYEDELRSGKWAGELSDAILACMKTTASKNFGRSGSLVPVQGYYEFTTGVQFCHAD